MALEKFSEEYNYVKGVLDSAVYEEPLQGVLAQVKEFLGASGPNESCNGKMELLRGLLTLHGDERTILASGGEANQVTPLEDQAVMRAAAIKFIRHLYLMGIRGGQKVWVFSSPKAFSHYPTDEIWGGRASMPQLKILLKDKDEQFSSTDKKNLSEATLTALNWSQKAHMTLSTAQANADSTAMATVKRWFAADDTPTAELNITITKVLAGFHKVSNTINKNLLIFTDMPSLRGATSGSDLGYLNSEAFVYPSRHEVIPVVYIESAFFSSGGNVLNGPKNWSRIIVHECTHLDCGTEDKKYAWAGIKPGAGITAAEAAVNADTWAYFAADCAGALTAGDISRAMGGITG
jgi:hypothetical protein